MSYKCQQGAYNYSKLSLCFVTHLKRLRVLCSSIRLLFPVRSSSCSVAGSESGSWISVSSLQLRSTSYECTEHKWADTGWIKIIRRQVGQIKPEQVWPWSQAGWGSLGRQWCGWSVLWGYAVSYSWTRWRGWSSACCHLDLAPPAVPAYSAY